jgi:hypothetical protein
MLKRSPITRIIKLSCVLLCIFILGLWCLSLKWGFVYVGKNGLMLQATGGLIYAAASSPNVGPRWSVVEPKAGIGFRRPSKWVHPINPTCRMYTVPMWILFFAFLLPSGILVLTDRSPKSSFNDCYTCGYNLFGNISGTCPECGTPIPKKTLERLANDPPK